MKVWQAPVYVQYMASTTLCAFVEGYCIAPQNNCEEDQKSCNEDVAFL